MKRSLTFAAILALTVLASAQTRRRPSAPPPEPAAARWLATRAYPLDDLSPLQQMIGNASVVALADGTHGTHEYFTTKLGIIQFLVTQMDFDTLAIEGSFSQMERVNGYVQGDASDLRSIIFPHQDEIDYHFWAVEEFVGIADWMRTYNLARRDRPAISIVGIDVWDGAAAAAMMPDLVAKQRFDDAAHATTVAEQALTATDPAARNRGMALNTQWATEHRSLTGKVILWGHGEHFGKTIGVEKVKNAGMWLADIFGAGYYTIGNAMWDGVYLGLNGSVTQPQEMTIAVTAVDPDGYENFFHASGDAAFLLSLHGPLHSFLLLPRPLRDAGFSVHNNWDFRIDLTKRFDAMVYVELTTPTHPLPPPN